MLTTESAGLDRPALSPWIYDRTATTATPYGYGAAAGSNAHLPPQGAATAFPPLALRGNPLPAPQSADRLQHRLVRSSTPPWPRSI